MKTIIVDGLEHTFFLEHGLGDGGAVVNHLSPGKDGMVVNFRHWFSDPARAQAAFYGIDADKATAAREMVVGIIDSNAAKIAAGNFNATVAGAEN